MHVVSSAEGKLNFQLIRGNVTWLVAASSEYVDFLCYCFCLCIFFFHFNQHCPWSLWVVSSGGGYFLWNSEYVAFIWPLPPIVHSHAHLVKLSLWLITSNIRENDFSFLPAGLALWKEVCDAPRIVLVWIIPQASCWCYAKYYKQLACILTPIWHFLSLLLHTHTCAHVWTCMQAHPPSSVCWALLRSQIVSVCTGPRSCLISVFD